MIPGAIHGGRAAAARSTFLTDQIATAGPAALLVMLYDRLVMDLVRAEDAQRAGVRETANANLIHAQDIINELLATLDIAAWEGAPGLASLYAYVLGELVRANVHGDAERTATCRRLMEPLRDAWREASTIALAST